MLWVNWDTELEMLQLAHLWRVYMWATTRNDKPLTLPPDLNVTKWKHFLHCLREATYHMAKTTKGDKTDGKYRAITWVNFSLSGEHLSSLENIGWDDNDLIDGLCQLAVSGYSVSVKIAPDGNSVMCTVTGVLDRCPNAGKGFSAFGSTAREAVLCALFKYHHVAPDKWGDSDNGLPARFR